MQLNQAGMATGLVSIPLRYMHSPCEVISQSDVDNTAKLLAGFLERVQNGTDWTPSLDNLLAGHAGLPMGKILLIEENGTTDFAGALLRYYAAEGVVQEQKIHVVGVPEQWGRSLPGLIGTAESLEEKRDKRKDEKMKIAWRYERLGEFGAGVAGSRDGE